MSTTQKDTHHYAIQDRYNGLICYVTAAASASAALASFDAEVGIDPQGIGLEAISFYYCITEITAEQYARLKDCDGRDQESIDYLDAITEDRR